MQVMEERSFLEIIFSLRFLRNLEMISPFALVKLLFFLSRFFCQTGKCIRGDISNEISKMHSKNNLNIYSSMGVHVENVYL